LSEKQIKVEDEVKNKVKVKVEVEQLSAIVVSYQP